MLITSLECQKEDWPQHKKRCVESAEGLSPQMKEFFAQAADAEYPFFRLLSDCFILRMNDDYVFGSHQHEAYRPKVNALPAFSDFLKKCEKAKLLPEWWDEEKETLCLAVAQSQSSRWFSIYDTIGLKQIIDLNHEAYLSLDVESGNDLLSALRLRAERVYQGGYRDDQAQMPVYQICPCEKYHRRYR